MARAATAITKHQLETNLIGKCWKDPEFRSEVLKDPKGMLEVFLGKSLAPDFKVVIHEEDPNTLHFALPPVPTGAAELSDEELERVAGGTELAMIVTVAIATAGVSGMVLSAAASVANTGNHW